VGAAASYMGWSFYRVLDPNLGASTRSREVVLPSPWDFGGWCSQEYSSPACSVVNPPCTMDLRSSVLTAGMHPAVEFTIIPSVCSTFQLCDLLTGVASPSWIRPSSWLERSSA
jgi:hypothetical protein